jgi:hypothetical protein
MATIPGRLGGTFYRGTAKGGGMEDGVFARLLEALEKTPPLRGHPILAELVHASREPIEGQWKYPFHL